ncbi:hypothetical protein GCM10017667_19340 [Streptomyces filamentosus]|uniref:Uncharacterized protein n=1 Tax=Streptomyces filamentosus TaxID=67294 RepID=A0A919EK51_STRFL|nr:hypothetical protein GCM10017667_19340 [Streptomyces filamentosus]
MPPWAFTQRAYAWAIAGMPGMLVARVWSGAQVITVTGSLEPPVAPGSTPHPVRSDAPAAAAVTDARSESSRLPVMDTNTSGTRVTRECVPFNGG